METTSENIVTTEQEESLMTAEQVAEMEAQKDMTFHSDAVKKIGGCAVVTVDDTLVTLEMPFSYSQLVSAIVKKKYDADKSEAVVANFMSAQGLDSVSEEKKAEYTAEYEAYQAWRERAKEVAKAAMGVEA